MQKFSKQVPTTRKSRVPVTQPLPGTNQVKNSAGGFVWKVTAWQRVLRFLVLGTEGGTYYIREPKLTQENATALLECLKENPHRLIALIAEVSIKNRAPSNDPALFALALVVTHATDADVKAAAYQQLPKIARIGTHLFHFVAYVNDLRGWGRGLRHAVGNWYNEKTPKALAEQLTKYQSRDGWSHRDVLRLSHPKPPSPSHAHMLKLAVGKVTTDEDVPNWVRQGKAKDQLNGRGSRTKFVENATDVVDAWQYLGAVRSMRADMPVAAACSLIRNFRLPREVVPTELLTKPEVWEALLPHMGLTAMIRNLATMTRVGLLKPMSEGTTFVINAIRDQAMLTKARVHPIAVLFALKTYAAGHGEKSANTWTPVQPIVDALDDAFYLAFGNVEPAGKRFMLAVDVSGSMDGSGYGGGLYYGGGFPDIRPGLSPRLGAAAMAMVTAKTEPWYGLFGFSTSLKALPVSPRQRLDDIVRIMRDVPAGGTDCSLPMRYAAHENLDVDTFVVYTDSETWMPSIHPSVALDQYRQKRGKDVKLVVCGMVSNGFTIADPNDPGMLDVVGFDAATPSLISSFARGEL